LKKVVAVTVGISLENKIKEKIGKHIFALLEREEAQKAREVWSKLKNVQRHSPEDLLAIEEWLLRELEDTNNAEDLPDCAETNILRNLLEEGIISRDTRIILVHGDDITKVAEKIEEMLKNKFGFENVERHPCGSISPKDPNTLEKFWLELEKIKKECEERAEELILAPVGGYKFITDLAYLFSLIYDLPSYYIYEEAKKLMKLPSIPVSWDYAFFVLQSPMLAEGRVESFFHILKRKEFLETLKHKLPYEDPVMRRISIKNETYRRLLEENIALWQDLWIGDMIPETVEHSKSHSKRVLQRFEVLYRDFGDSFFERLELDDTGRDKYLFYLYSAAYLHDIGHTVLSLKGKGYNLNDYPEFVREYHNVLTAYALMESRGFLGLDALSEEDFHALTLVCLYHRKKMGLTPETHDPTKHPEHVKNKLERKLVRELLGFEDVALVENPLFKRMDKATQKIVLQVAATLKFLDELDIQADRIVSKTYMKARFKRLLDEIGIILSQTKESEEKRKVEELVNTLRNSFDEFSQDPTKAAGKIEDLVESLKSVHKRVYDCILKDEIPSEEDKKLSQLLFKLVQFAHFGKHSSVDAVLPRYEEGKGIYVEVVGNLKVCEQDIREQVEKLKQDQLFLRDIKLLPADFSEDLFKERSVGERS